MQTHHAHLTPGLFDTGKGSGDGRNIGINHNIFRTERFDQDRPDSKKKRITRGQHHNGLGFHPVFNKFNGFGDIFINWLLPRGACLKIVQQTLPADQYIRSGMCSRILVIGAEVHSKSLDISDRGRDLTVLFGDGAGAVVVEANEVDSFEDSGQIFSSHLHNDGKHARELWMPAPTQTRDSAWLTHEMLDAGDQYPVMNGKKVFVAASKAMPESIHEACAANGVTPDDIDLYLFHQANLRINQQVAKSLNVGEDKVFNTIQDFGNTTAATIPIGMAEALKAGRLERGMLVALSAFGSGFGWGSVLLRY